MMKKYRKIVAICLVLVMNMFLFPATAGEAAEIDRIVAPMYIDIDTFSNSFDINPSNGKATVYTAVYAGVADRTSVGVSLQKYNNGSWSLVTSWSARADGPYAYVLESYYVGRGQYRIASNCFVYVNGRCTDWDTYTSYIVTY